MVQFHTEKEQMVRVVHLHMHCLEKYKSKGEYYNEKETGGTYGT